MTINPYVSKIQIDKLQSRRRKFCVCLSRTPHTCELPAELGPIASHLPVSSGGAHVCADRARRPSAADVREISSGRHHGGKMRFKFIFLKITCPFVRRGRMLAQRSRLSADGSTWLAQSQQRKRK